MFLIDTSVWIDYFRERQNAGVQFFEQIIEDNISYGITSLIYQEILQAAASLGDYQKLMKYLGSQTFFHPNSIHTHESAAKLYFNCRRKGITIRSTIDCLIAQIAIEQNLVLVHHDDDYRHLQKIEPKLKLFDKKNG